MKKCRSVGSAGPGVAVVPRLACVWLENTKLASNLMFARYGIGAGLGA